MANSFAEDVVVLKLLADRLCEGKNKCNGLFLVSYQILFVLSEEEFVSPKKLVEDLGIAKSNLALIAKSMQNKGLLSVSKDEKNRKEIYYSITSKGKEMLANKVAQIDNQVSPQLKEQKALLDKAINVLKLVKD